MSDGDRLGDYREVKDRLPEFFERFPEGSVQTELIEFTVTGRGEAQAGRKTYDDQIFGHVVMKAMAFRKPDDPRPGIGYSSMRMPGTTPYTLGAELENAETSAVGRALVNIGIQAHNGYASQDEIEAKEASRGEGREEERVVGSSGRREERSTGRLATDAMKRKFFAKGEEAELTAEQLKLFVFNVTGKASTKELTYGDMDKLFLAFDDEEKVEFARSATSVEDEAEPASVAGGD